MKNKNIYLDNHASTSIDKRVFRIMEPFLKKDFGNPHSESHTHGWIANKYIELSRQKIAKSLNVQKEEIFFTSGATESNNLVLKGLAFSQKNKNHIITCVTEHKCILESCKFLETLGCKISYLKVNKFGEINLNDFKRKITKKTFLVSLMHVNNEIGTIHPLKKISKICKKKKIFFHSDLSQSVGKILTNIKDLELDFASFSSHKIHGPQGIGGLFIKKNKNLKIMPLISGGGQEKGLRSGTLPTALCVGFGEAVRLITTERTKNNKKIKKMKEIFIKILSEERINFKLNGKNVIDNNINITFLTNKIDFLFSKLTNISISSGSACGSGSGEPSYALKEIGLTNSDAKCTLRIGLGKDNTEKELTYTANKISNLLKN